MKEEDYMLDASEIERLVLNVLLPKKIEMFWWIFVKDEVELGLELELMGRKK